MLHQTVANRQSKEYYYLMTELSAVESRHMADFTYDIDMNKVSTCKRRPTIKGLRPTISWPRDFTNLTRHCQQKAEHFLIPQSQVLTSYLNGWSDKR